MLESMGYRVTSRTSSVEALNAFKGSPNGFDLVITDMTMPQMTGLQLAQDLKKLHRNIKIIICTGFSEQLNEASADRWEIDGFLMKPVIMTELSKLVRNVLDK
jgi:CheY-like chemotaxis protein